MKKVFLVEDDKTISKNLMLLLKSEGFAVSHACAQREAVDMLAKSRFDIALVDISLPDGNGFAVCTVIKQTQNIPVIFLTASGDEASVVTGLNMGADDYITKPFRPRELIARIGAALRKADCLPKITDEISSNTPAMIPILNPMAAAIKTITKNRAAIRRISLFRNIAASQRQRHCKKGWKRGISFCFGISFAADIY